MALKGQLAGDRNPAWRGGHAGYRGPSWVEQRTACRARDVVCQRCGSDRLLTVHHVVPFRLFATHEEANDLANLRLLCRPCHSDEDNAFWSAHPELTDSVRASFPDCRIRRDCDTCGQTFNAASAEKQCLACSTHRCDVCGSTFVSRRRRAVRFCSKACNVAFRKSEAIYPHACITCGVKIASGRYRCLSCHRADPSLEVRPGRRPGRPPKDRSAT